VPSLRIRSPCPIPRGPTLVRWSRRTASAVLAVTTTLAITAPAASAAPTTTDDPVAAAAGWLATQLVDGERIETAFGGEIYPDQGVTADVVFALSGAGVASGEIETATDWLEAQVGAYTGEAWGDVYAGAVGKLLVVAATTGRDAADFGGVDLVALLEAREQGSGRYSDQTDGDWSNVITQSLGVLGLHRTEGAAPSAAAIAYLADRACDDGGFPSELEPATCTGDVDATGFAVQALLPLRDGEPEVAAAVEAAVAWLVDEQAEDGSFGGPDSPANANSTGVAASALAGAGQDDAVAAARGFLLGLQATCGEEEAGSISFDAADPGDRARASAQAVLGLGDEGLATVTAAGASSDVPTLDCEDAAAPRPEAEPEPADDGAEPAPPTEDGQAPAAGAEPREGTEAAPGEMPRTGTAPTLLAVLGLSLLAGGVLTLRRATAT
jgi:hypothetical protein